MSKDTQILTLISEGYKAKEIGKIMGMSHRTIEDRVAKLKFTHDAKNLPNLVFIAIKNKLIKL